MSLVVGTRLGPYEIQSAIGAGGMGEVYRARDTKLDRDVALKVLPDHFAADSERLARFKREAKVVASLNHPNIAHVYGLEEAAPLSGTGQGAVRAIVMELVEGATLADRITRGAIPLEEALPIARQIAEALEAAHERGIIHRDLKPANIKVRDEGTVKVLDFGLAKALDPGGSSEVDAANSPTLTSPATQMGVILGTAAYMSPEQAKGRPVDKRTDVWAFGCVLYEMLTGRRAFAGDDVSDTLASILMKDPDWSALPANVPLGVRKLLRRCLERDRRRRLDSVADARLEIDDATSDEFAGGDATSRSPSSRVTSLALVAVSLLATILAAWGWLRSVPEVARPVRFTIPVPEGHLMFAGEGPRLALSADGSSVAWVSNDGFLHVRRLDEFDSRRLDGTERAESPFFSPDGRWIGFARNGGLHKIGVDGGPVIEIRGVTGTEFGVGAQWHSSGVIVYTPFGGSAGVWSVPEEGGTPSQLVTRRPDELQTTWPQLLDEDKLLLYSAGSGGTSFSQTKTFLTDLGTGDRFQLAEGGTYARYVATGHVVYTDGAGTVFARPVDLTARRATGPPFPVQAGVRVAYWNTGAASLQVSPSGTAAFVLGSTHALHRIGWVNRTGRITGYLGGPLTAEDLRLSPDGTRLLTYFYTPDDADLWMIDVRNGHTTRLTDAAGWEWRGVWSPDGKRVAHQGAVEGRQALFVRDAAPGRPSVQVLASDTDLWTDSWSPDGRWVAYAESSGKGKRNVYAADMENVGRKMPIAETNADEFDARFAPGGEVVAYVSDDEIVVASFPDLGWRRTISKGGGLSPRWSPRGDELLYWQGTALVSHAWKPDAPQEFGPPRVLFTRLEQQMEVTRYWDVDRDGQRFLVVLANPDAPARQIHVDTDWFGRLKQAAGVR